MAENSTPLNINERLLKIIDPTLVERGPKECWFDGEGCPYGQPHGQFVNRPKAFCRIGTCSRLADTHADMNEVSGNYIERQIESRILELFGKEGATLSSELRVIASEEFDPDQDEDNKSKQGILVLAADILEAEDTFNSTDPKMLSERSFIG